MCRQHGLAVTHQRQVIFEALTKTPGHPTSEDVYTRVKQAIPSMSLATVYKTLHTFVEHGILRELSPLHGSLRMDWNTNEHHHLVCTRCKKVMDIDLDDEGLRRIQARQRLPRGFKLQRVAVEVQGLCATCAE